MIVKYSDGVKQIRFTKAIFYIQWIYDKVNIPVFITQSVKASTGTKLKENADKCVSVCVFSLLERYGLFSLMYCISVYIWVVSWSSVTQFVVF